MKHPVKLSMSYEARLIGFLAVVHAAFWLGVGLAIGDLLWGMP